MRRTTACIALLSLALSQPVAARERPSDACDYVIAFDVTLAPSQVVLGDGDSRYALSGDHVARNGREIGLRPGQRAAAAQYRAGWETLVPAISDIARRAALLGIESVALVGAALSGGDDAIAHAAERIEALALRLHLQIDDRHLDAGKALGKAPLGDADFDEEINALARDAGSGLMADVAAFVGRAVFDPETVAARGEYVGRLVEHRIEPRAQALGAQADRICAQLRALDALESQMDLFDAIRPDRTI